MPKAQAGQGENETTPQTPVEGEGMPPSPEPDSGPTGGLDDIADELASQQPEINQGVLDAEARDRAAVQNPQFERINVPSPATPYNTATPQPGSAGPAAPPRARGPVQFNAEIHQVNPDGTPMLTATGRFKRKQGLPRAVRVVQNGQLGIPCNAELIAQGAAKNKMTADWATSVKETLTMSLISDEWRLTPEEKLLEVSTLTGALNHYSPMGAPMHPLVAYAGVVAMHAGKRFTEPKTLSWFDVQKGRLASWWVNRKTKKAGQNAAQSDSRGNNVGQDNSSNPTAK